MNSGGASVGSLENLALSKAIRMCIAASGENTVPFSLEDGFCFIFLSKGEYQIVPLQEYPQQFYSFPYHSDQVFRSLKETTGQFEPLEILAYVVSMAIGGVERNTIAVLAEMSRSSAILASRNVDVNDGDLTTEAFREGIPVITFNDLSSGTCDLNLVTEAFRAKWLWICNWSMEDNLVNHNFYKQKRNYKIADQRSYDHIEGWINTINLDYLNAIDVLIATNAPIKARLLSDFHGKHEEKILIIRSSLRFKNIEPRLKPHVNSACDFYQIARIVPQKRIDRGLILADALRTNGFLDSWNIVGDGSLRSELEIASWDNEFVRFFGYQDSQFALEKSCALIQTSDFEGLPLVIIEALSMGVPVFSTKTGDLEWLRENLPAECRPILELFDLDEETSIAEKFLAWRINFEEVCDLNVRSKAGNAVRELFSLSDSAGDYSRAFHV